MVDNKDNSDLDALVSVEYTPMQCEVTPWDDWLKNSKVRFIKAPSEPQILAIFYGQEKYTVTLDKVAIIKTSDATCDACGADRGYKIQAYVKLKDIQVMLDTGWRRVYSK